MTTYDKTPELGSDHVRLGPGLPGAAEQLPRVCAQHELGGDGGVVLEEAHLECSDNLEVCKYYLETHSQAGPPPDCRDCRDPCYQDPL